MKRVSGDLRFLLMTTIIVAVLGFRALFDLSSEDVVRVSEAKTVSAPSPREPASLPPIQERPRAISAAVDPLLQWDCSVKKSAPSLEILGAQVRLKGTGCGKDFVADRLKIVNETNGFTASVFLKNGAHYETDLIQLQAGMNQVHIRYESASGPRVETVLNVKSLQN